MRCPECDNRQSVDCYDCMGSGENMVGDEDKPPICMFCDGEGQVPCLNELHESEALA